MSETNADAARKALQNSAAKIDQKLVLANNDSISHVAARKMLSIVDDHGPKGVVSVTMLPNWSEGATPRDLPSGYRMIFNVKEAAVVPSAYPMNLMYGGTMAVRVPNNVLSGSPLSPNGLMVHASELVQMIKGVNVDAEAGFDDAYVGLYEHTKRSVADIEHEYWMVTRYVNPALNAELSAEVEQHADNSMHTFLKKTADLRHKTFNVQRTERAKKISEALSLMGVRLTPEAILSARDSYVDSACYALNDSKVDAKGEAELYSDAVRLTSSNLSAGVVLSENMRLGPVLLRAQEGAIVRHNDTDVFQASTGFIAPLWRAASEAPALLKFTSSAQLSPNNAHVWSNGALQRHPLLAVNAFRPRNENWHKMEKMAGFEDSRRVEFTPVAVKIASHATTNAFNE